MPNMAWTPFGVYKLRCRFAWGGLIDLAKRRLRAESTFTLIHLDLHSHDCTLQSTLCYQVAS